MVFFRNLYSSVGARDYIPVLTQCPQMVTTKMNEALITEVSREEVKQATFQLGATKAPGPDGFNGLFYQTYWDFLQEDIFTSVQTFFTSSVMPPVFNRTLITLIPKTPHAELISNEQSAFVTDLETIAALLWQI